MLETLKVFLNITKNDKDALLNQILQFCEAPVLSYIGEQVLPVSLHWVVVEMAIIRYNRLNSEGITSESVDGGSVSYVENAFNLYKSELDTYISNRNKNKRGATFY